VLEPALKRNMKCRTHSDFKANIKAVGVQDNAVEAAMKEVKNFLKKT